MIVRALIWFEEKTWDLPAIGNNGILTRFLNWIINKLWSPDIYVTKSGKKLTDKDIWNLSEEAERGYDISQIKYRLACRECGEAFEEGETPVPSRSIRGNPLVHEECA